MFAAKNELFTTPSGYQIQRSLRFRSSASAYLNRTPASSSGQQTFTISAWVKRGTLSTQQVFFGINSASTNIFTLAFLSGDTLRVFGRNAGSDVLNLTTTAVFRDPSAWYHIVLAVDTTQATAANRVRMYVNGVEVTAFGTATYPAQNTSLAWNSNSYAHEIGRESTGNYFDGYLTEINSISGTQLTPSSFGAINAVTGVWSATRYNGTYGTNGFYLNFTDNSAATAATIGKDYSGNGNNWTPNNISVTAGVTYDSMLDAPLGAGGGERGNYAVLNPLLSSGGTTANANLQVTTTVGVGHSRPTMAIPASGKWYCEFTAVSAATSTDYIFGIVGIDTPEASYGYNQTPSYSYSAFGEKIVNGSFTASFYSTFTNNDIIGCAVNLDGNEINWYKNGTLAGSATSIANGSYFWMISDASGSRQVTAAFNAGQRPFSYTPPTGFKALHTGNLAAPVIALPAQNMAATTYTGNGLTQTVNNSGGFYPDFNWIKARSNAGSHVLVNSVAGGTKQLFSNLTNAEQTNTNITNGISSSGIALGSNASGTGSTNQSAYTYVLWQWLAGGGTSSSNTAGSRTSTVSANTTSGFSVVSYAGQTNTPATIGHGLGITPGLVITKNRSNGAYDWCVWHSALSGTQYLSLNTTAAVASAANAWNSTTPTSSVFSVGQFGETCGLTGNDMIAYCFAPVAGYSAFGSYTGNGSADGPFVYTGFRPRWLMIKCSSTDGGGTSQWMMVDSARNTSNVENNILKADLADSEGVGSLDLCDFLSNGFKIRNTSGRTNTSSETYIYIAFAESPFKNSLAR